MKNSFSIIILILLVSCSKNENQPLTGSKWGEIQNPSLEEVVSSTVQYWSTDSRGNSADHFYDYDSFNGNKSISIKANEFSSGRWWNKVNLKPWSRYKFTAWIKTNNIVPSREKGAGIRLDGLDIEWEDFTGTNDWTKIEYEFNTGKNDATTISCLLSLDGRASGSVWFDYMDFELVSSEAINTAISIDPTIQAEPISEYVYGQFIEHLGRCIYGGIWAEMIQDRKFYYSPADRLSPWSLSGERDLLLIDSESSYVGDITPGLQVKAGSDIIIKQDNLGLREGIDYTGRIILKTDPGIRSVSVKLSGSDYYQTNTIECKGRDYNEYPLAFTSTEFTQSGSIEISAEGEGKVYIGTISLMPADNINGFRSDVLTLLKELNSPVYRWPGGNFVSGYDWKDGIGPRDKRPPRKNPAWTGVEHNDVGMHEFINFCRLIDTEPYIAVNAGLGGVEEARQQVEYCNGSSSTPMGKLRTQNGDADSWEVKWWSIGNEMYGGWQLGHMSTEEFVDKHNQFAAAMRSVDSSIKLVAVGDVGRWDEMIMANCSDNMDLISEHFYRQDWHAGGLMTHVNQIPEAIKHKTDAHRRYREEIPGLASKDIRICLDEYNYWYGPHIYGELGTRYFLRDALGIAAGMNEFARQSDMIFMANYAQTVNVIGCIKTNTTHSVMAATGQVLKLYRSKFGSIPVRIDGEERPLDIAATLNSSKDTIIISAVNANWKEIVIKTDVSSANVTGDTEQWTITGPDDMAFNEPGKPERVIIEGPVNLKGHSELKVEPFSINIFRIPVKF